MTKSNTGNRQSVKQPRLSQSEKVGAVLAKKTAKADAKSKAKSKGKKKSSASWGIKHVLATHYAPTFPPISEPQSNVLNAIEALHQAYVQLSHDSEKAKVQADGKVQEHTTDRGCPNSEGTESMEDTPTTTGPKLIQTKARTKESPTNGTLSEQGHRRFPKSERPPRLKPYGLLVGINEVTRALERQGVSVAAVARDVGTTILISHLPALCATSGALLVPVPDDGRRLGAAVGVGRASVVAIAKDNKDAASNEENKAIPEPLKNLAHIWSQLASPLNFSWLPSLDKQNGDANSKQKAQLLFQKPVLIPHRDKVKREVLGIPEGESMNENEASE